MTVDPQRLLGSADDHLWPHLASMWREHDPVPDGLVEQVLVGLAMEDLDTEYELLHLVDRTDRLAGVRGTATDTAMTISFSGNAFSLLLRVSRLAGDRRRVDAEAREPGGDDRQVLVLREGIEAHPQAEALGERDLLLHHFARMDLAVLGVEHRDRRLEIQTQRRPARDVGQGAHPDHRTGSLGPAGSTCRG